MDDLIRSGYVRKPRGGDSLYAGSVAGPAGVIAASEFFTADPPPVGDAGYVPVWLGSSWIRKPAKVWSGSAWEIKPAKRWSGAAWLTT